AAAANRQITEKGESRASTMSGSGSGNSRGAEESRANSLKVEGAKVAVPVPVAAVGKKMAVDNKRTENSITPESFQRGGFYS
ncbi:MAG: hypothetical protein Q9191_007079, partial [Dirinaria sp. TL-2023a]